MSLVKIIVEWQRKYKSKKEEIKKKPQGEASEDYNAGEKEKNKMKRRNKEVHKVSLMKNITIKKMKNRKRRNR